MGDELQNGIAAIATLEREVCGAFLYADSVERQRKLMVELGLTADHFQDHRTKLTFRAMELILENGLPVNTRTLEHQILKSRSIDAAMSIITDISMSGVSPDGAFIHDYAKEIKQAAINRKAIELLAENLERARRWPHDASELVSETRGELQRLEDMRPELRTYHTVRDIAAGMREFASRPWIPFGVGGEVIESLPLGESLFLMGPSGSGKSTLAFSLTSHHARHHGPALVVSRELSEVTAAARVGAIQTQSSWRDVLCGAATEQAIAALAEMPRMVFLDGKRASFSGMERAIRELKNDFPGEPIMVLVDYVQLMRVDGADMRSRVADAIELLRDLVQDTRVVGLMLSQMSREKSNAARKGGRLGADTMDGGGETGAIEQAAALTAELGRKTEPAADGSVDVQLSIGKFRYGGGDRVLELRQWGSSGLTRILRDQPASVVREFEQRAKEDAKRKRVSEALLAAAQAAPAPVSRKELLETVGGNHGEGRAAIAALIANGALVELAETRKHSRAPLVWTKERATEAGKPTRSMQ